MFRQSVLMEFLTFAAFYVILKVLLQFINIESRRAGWHLPAAVSGILA
jgi:hypothetical protein